MRASVKASAILSLRALAATVVLAGGLAAAPARACGYGSPVVCDDNGTGPENEARYMLKRVATALDADRAKAFDAFSHGTGGFRTADTYVFCIGPDGVMNAHPSPILQGHDVRDLHDKTGNYFIKAMMETARPGKISVIRYLFPKPGGTVAVPKTTYYTKVGDQTCAVGFYDGDEGNAARAETAQERVAQLRRKLDAEIPETARADWSAFLEALNARSGEQDAAMAQARERLNAAMVALAPPAGNASAGGE